ncbi:hypothetical protein [Nocardioides limicola]|uniref:hypothetical protein n=1 Tax=Nocardioides limicola TaxID=2803368 RepID=UPI00193B67B7|nr:hypothetical protein [Nocardioides sp. DJM-14]
MDAIISRPGGRIVVLVLAFSLLLGCGQAPAPTRVADDGTAITQGDVDFVTELLQHDAEGLVLIDALDAARSEEPLDAGDHDLVEATRAELAGSVEMLVDQLSAWGEAIPATARDHVHGGHGDEDEPAPTVAPDVAEFRQLLVDHHRAAVELTHRHELAATTHLAEEVRRHRQPWLE